MCERFSAAHGVDACIGGAQVQRSVIVSASPEATPRHAVVHHAAAGSRAPATAHLPVRRIVAAVSLAGALAVVTFAATDGNAGASTTTEQVNTPP